MSTPRRLWATLLASSILGLAGCITINDADTAQPQPSVSTVVVTAEASSPAAESPTPSAASVETSEPEQAPTTATQAAPVGVAPGTSCGPSNTGRTTLVVAETSGEITCEQVQSIFADFNAAFAQGGTHHVIQGYSCAALRDPEIEKSGRSVTCIRVGNRLEAMTVYPLGGIPVEFTSEYLVPDAKDIAWFETDFGYCSMIPINSTVSCTRTKTAPPSNPLVMDQSTPPHYLPTGGSYPSQGSSPIYLPAGYTLTYSGMACLNEGHQITCDNGVYRFSISPTGDSL